MARILLAALALGIASPAEAGPQTLTQTTSSVVVSGNSATCSSVPGTTAETRFYRRFHLSDYGISGPFTVASVTFGVEAASGGADARQSVFIRLYDSQNLTSPGLPVANMNVTVTDQANSLVTVPVPAVITSGDLIVEVLLPDGSAGGDSIVIGSNSGGQTAPSYIQAPVCAIPLMDLSLLVPQMHVVMTVSGTSGAASCELGLSKTTYTLGDTITVSDLRLVNGSLQPATTEFKMWLDAPGPNRIGLVNAGADGSVTLPASLDTRTGAFALFAVTAATPRGLYQVGCRILDPKSGEIFATSVRTFTIH